MAEITIIGGINIDIEGCPFGSLKAEDSNPGKISLAYGGVGRNIAENAALLVRGRISVRDEKEPQLMVDSIRPLSDLHELGTDAPPKAERKLWVKLPTADAKLMRRIELLCEMFPGRERMIIFVADTKRRLGAECLIRDSLVRELQELLGEENVVVK